MWFSAGWEMKEIENVFLTHGWESRYRCVGHFRSCDLFGFSFCFAICHCLTCPTHPPLKYGTCRRCKVRWNYSLATFLCHCKTIILLCSNDNKAPALWFGSAWLPVVCQNKSLWLIVCYYWCYIIIRLLKIMIS